VNKENIMAPINIPEGYVFVKRGPGVAAALLEAADEIKADRKNGVRTVSGGYHVAEDIAAKWQEGLPEAEQTAVTGTGEDGGQTGDAGDDPKADDPKTATPREGWTHAQFDEWAENQDPKVEYPSGANLKQKLEIATKPAAE
jgi:hypothetical protein